MSEKRPTQSQQDGDKTLLDNVEEALGVPRAGQPEEYDNQLLEPPDIPG